MPRTPHHPLAGSFRWEEQLLYSKFEPNCHPNNELRHLSEEPPSASSFCDLTLHINSVQFYLYSVKSQLYIVR